MFCETCRKEIKRDQSFEAGEKSYCSECFFRVASAFRENITPEQKKRLRELVREEIEGLLPRAAIREIIEEGFNRIASRKGSAADELGHVVNQIERICGMVMFREILSVVSAIKTTLEAQEDELRSRLRNLHKI